jgi:HK97 family phage portal protein
LAIFDALRTFFTLPPSFATLDHSPVVMDEERALSFETIFGHDLEPGGASRVTSESARKNPFVWACQSIISGTIANLPVDILRKEGEIRVPVASPPSWVDEPNPFNPNYTSISYKRQLALSLLQDGNAFVAVSPDVDEAFRLLVLNPAQVEIKDGDDSPVYVVTDAGKRLTLAVLSARNCLHIPFILPPGYTRGLNPVEAAALSIGIDLASQKQASKFISGGGLVTGVIEVPREAGDLTQQQMDDLREGFKRKREGPAGYSIGVLQGGATFKPISQSQAESEYIAGRKMSREEIAGMYLVPAFMIGSQEPGGVAYASAVERAQHFIDYCLLHYTGPLELGHRRLIPGADTYFKFNFNALLRGDLKTRAGIYDSLLQDRVMKVDEARTLEDWAPLGEDNGGGFLNTPNNNFTDPRIADLGTLIRAGFDPESSAAAVGLSPIKHLGLVPVTVQGENVATESKVSPPPARSEAVHIHMDEITLPDTVAIPAPVVHLPAPIVNVEPPPAPDMTPFADAVRELQDILAYAVVREVERDVAGRPIRVVERRVKP